MGEAGAPPPLLAPTPESDRLALAARRWWPLLLSWCPPPPRTLRGLEEVLAMEAKTLSVEPLMALPRAAVVIFGRSWWPLLSPVVLLTGGGLGELLLLLKAEALAVVKAPRLLAAAVAP